MDDTAAAPGIETVPAGGSSHRTGLRILLATLLIAAVAVVVVSWNRVSTNNTPCASFVAGTYPRTYAEARARGVSKACWMRGPTGFWRSPVRRY